MNPYDFVRVDWDHPGRRGSPLLLDRFGGLSGRVEGTITTLTPFFIPDKKPSNINTAQPFLRSRGQEIIPGSSLKGLFRNVVETIDGGYWWFFGRDGVWRDNNVPGRQVDYSTKLPKKFQRPQDIKQLDAACRMFGFLHRGSVQLGRVTFEDATSVIIRPHQAIYTCILSTPKPRHGIWYLDSQNRVAGRKFYFHAQNIQEVPGWLPRPDVPPQQRQNAYIKPIDAGSVFTFTMHFTNLEQDDFALLLYVLVLEPAMRHKFGYAKPAGLGSIEVKLNWIELVDHKTRYRAGGGGFTRYARESDLGDTLTPFVQSHTLDYTNNTTSITLNDLRRIWQWPPVHHVRYPNQNWFAANRNTPISGTP